MNAYEIRLEILRIAHGDMTQQYHNKVDAIRCNSEKKNEAIDENIFTKLYPKSSEILARAEELYVFVEGK